MREEATSHTDSRDIIRRPPDARTSAAALGTSLAPTIRILDLRIIASSAEPVGTTAGGSFLVGSFSPVPEAASALANPREQARIAAAARSQERVLKV
jgi:hypothetical protein